MVAAVRADEHVGGVGTVRDLDVGGILVLVTFIIHFGAADELGFLHARDIVEVYLLGDGGAVLGDGLEVVGHFFALVGERFADSLAADIEDDRRDFEGGLREEVLRREGHGDGSVDVAVDNLKHFRNALDGNLVGRVDHLLGLVAGSQSEAEHCDEQQVNN